MSATVDGKATIAGLELLAAGIVQASGLALRAGVAAAEQSAKATTRWKDKSGETRKSIVGRVESYSRGFVRAGGASVFLENGTRPHPINAPVFIAGVGWRFIRMHPGTAETLFMSEARSRGEQAAQYGAEYYAGEVIRRIR